MTALPAGTDRAAAIAVLHDHAAMMGMGPHMKEFRELAADPAHPGARVYCVVDVMDMLPAGLWSSNVESTYLLTNTAEGLDMTLHAPLDVAMDTRRCIADGPDGGLVLDEHVAIACSRLLLGTVKGQCQGNYAEIHRKFIERVQHVQAEAAAA